MDTFPQVEAREPVLELGDVGAEVPYLEQQVSVRVQAERLCPQAFLLSTSPWEEGRVTSKCPCSVSPVLDYQSGFLQSSVA